MSMFSPTVRVNAAGGDTGGAGAGLFNALTQGNTLNHAMNQRLYEGDTLAQQINARNAGLQAQTAWSNNDVRTGNRFGQAWDAYNQQHPLAGSQQGGMPQQPGLAQFQASGQAPMAGQPQGMGNPFGVQPQPAAQQQISAPQPGYGQPGAYGAGRPAYPQGSDYAPQQNPFGSQMAPPDILTQMAFHSRLGHPGTPEEADSGNRAWHNFNLQQNLTSPAYMQAYQRYAQSGFTAPAAAELARQSVAGPELGFYQQSPLFHQGFQNVQSDIGGLEGIFGSTGNAMPFNAAAGGAPAGTVLGGFTGIHNGPGGIHYEAPYGDVVSGNLGPISGQTIPDLYNARRTVQAANAAAARGDYARAAAIQQTIPRVAQGALTLQEAVRAHHAGEDLKRHALEQTGAYQQWKMAHPSGGAGGIPLNIAPPQTR